MPLPIRHRAARHRAAGHRAAALLCAGTLAACGAEGTDEVAPEPTAAPTAELPPEPPPVEMDDIRPPEFDGVTEVELIGLEYFRVRWEPAVDDVSPPDALRYRVYHVVEPYRELEDDAAPIFTSEPGATEAVLANDAPPGRFYVRAIDEAGNASPIDVGLLQRPRRPLLRASDGTLAARITECLETSADGTGGTDAALCVGEEGFAARWDGSAWQSIDLGVVAPIRIADTPGGTFLYTTVGHLFRLDEDGTAHLVDLSFPSRAPELPFRQFTADAIGLRYWLDNEGRVFVGADREFVPMSRPLALPGNDCRRLRGLVFTDAGNFALCNDGAAFSADPRDPGAMWLSLTPNAEFELEGGLRGVIASDDTEGILFDDTGIRRVGVGGWTPLLLENWQQPGIHPMDVPEDPPPVDHVAQVFVHDDALHAVTNLGLLVRDGAEWEVVEDTEGLLAGVVGPSAGGDVDDWTFLYEDGAVGRVRRRGRQWVIPSGLSGFVAGAMTSGGTALGLVGGEDPVWFAWGADGWDEAFEAAPESATVAGFAEADGTVRAFGSTADGVGMIWDPNDEWDTADWLYEPPPEPVDEDDDDDDDEREDEDEDAFAMVFDEEPPPPIAWEEADAFDEPPPAPEPFVHVDIDASGRGVAVGAHQVWWRLDRGWRLMTTRPGTLTAAFLDAGETYVLIEDGTPRRCWRDDCTELVPQTDGGPWQAARAFAAGDGWELLESDGKVWRFVPAVAEDLDLLIDPAVETPVGVWEETSGVGAFAGSMAQRIRGTNSTALLTETGEIHEARGDEWVLQAEDTDALTLLAVDGRWAILTERGLFLLGEVRPARREAPDSGQP